MAALTANRPIPTLTPLENLTNHAYTSPEASGPSLGSSSPDLQPLRRTKSFQRLTHLLDSSESLPSESTSIYNAKPVDSEGDENSKSARLVFDEGWPLPPGGLPLSPSVNDLNDLSETPVPPVASPQPQHARSDSHSRWPAMQLDTILESISLKSLRTSTSLPRLSSSPGRHPQILQRGYSIRSVHPKQTSWPLPQPLPKAYLGNHRSFSLTDLDCRQRPNMCASDAPPRSVSSSSSTDALQLVCPCPTLPGRPICPPPNRIPTPPGIPSFGTREALALRLEPPLQSDSSSLFSLRRHHDSPGSAVVSPLGSPERVRSPPMDMLKRILGLSRIVHSPPPQSTEMARMPLPSNVQALARADDGTLVRGVFGGRASGHGIGRRGLERHPFQMAVDGLSGTSRIEEEVRMIDKACEAATTEQEMTATIRSTQNGGTPSQPDADGRRSQAVDDGSNRPSALEYNSAVDQDRNLSARRSAELQIGRAACRYFGHIFVHGQCSYCQVTEQGPVVITNATQVRRKPVAKAPRVQNQPLAQPERQTRGMTAPTPALVHNPSQISEGRHRLPTIARADAIPTRIRNKMRIVEGETGSHGSAAPFPTRRLRNRSRVRQEAFQRPLHAQIQSLPPSYRQASQSPTLSPRSDDVIGIREFIEQNERRAVERQRQISEQREQQSWFDSCMTGFCSVCCGEDCLNMRGWGAVYEADRLRDDDIGRRREDERIGRTGVSRGHAYGAATGNAVGYYPSTAPIMEYPYRQN